MAKEKILVVDDEEDILELVSYNLTREGHHVKGAATGEVALKLIQTESIRIRRTLERFSAPGGLATIFETAASC